MSGIKYYHLAKDEEPPDEFCAVKDVGGEPSEYTFYVPESEVAKLRELMYERAHEYTIQHMTEDELRIMAANALDENRKLREVVRDMFRDFANCDYELKRHGRTFMVVTRYLDRMHELGVEVK